MPDPKQFELSTPSGPDVLLFHKLEAHEALGRLSYFQIECFSEKTDLDLDALLGKMASLSIALPNEAKRHLSGYITRFGHVGTEGRYQAYAMEIHPWPWFLTRTSDCRIFQNKTVPEIVKEVFADHQGIAEYRDALSGNYRTREYCVQYRETDFDFICRLLEDEGIYFFFEYERDKNVLVLADAYGAHAPSPGLATLEFVDNFRAEREACDHVRDWRFERVVQPGKTRLIDYDFTRPKLKLDASATEPRSHNESEHEVFDYPGNFEQQADGTHYARARIDELQAQYELARGKTNARALGVGQLFKLTGHARRDQNREYLVTESRILAQAEGFEAQDKIAGSQYDCEFSALQSQQDFRPQRSTLKPHVRGPQTAVVVGPTGDEVYTDKYGRVKVQFHWDRRGHEDENSSCWMRVSQPWAGKNWGFVSIPRIGQEVVVEFLEGDPDHPLITGSVYNGEQMPPWDLPNHKTSAGLRSRSTVTGSAENFNEIRFEDQKGQEHIYIHAERDHNQVVENSHSAIIGVDSMSRIGRNEIATVAQDQTLLVGNNRAQTVGANETLSIGGNQSVSVGHNQSVNIGGHNCTTIGQAHLLRVGGAEAHSVGGSQNVNVGGTQTSFIGGQQMSLVQGVKTTLVGGSYSTIVGATSSHMAAVYKLSAGTFQLNVAATRKTTVMGIDSLTVGGQRKETIGANLAQQVGGLREAKVGGVDQLTVGGARTVKIGGVDSLQVAGAVSTTAGAAISLTAGGVVSITAAGAATITATAVTINAPLITLTGNVVVMGTLTTAGAIMTTSIISPIYTPGVGNLV